MHWSSRLDLTGKNNTVQYLAALHKGRTIIKVPQSSNHQYETIHSGRTTSCKQLQQFPKQMVKSRQSELHSQNKVISCNKCPLGQNIKICKLTEKLCLINACWRVVGLASSVKMIKNQRIRVGGGKVQWLYTPWCIKTPVPNGTWGNSSTSYQPSILDPRLSCQYWACNFPTINMEYTINKHHKNL